MEQGIVAEPKVSSYLRETGEGVILEVQVQPRSFRNEVVGPYGDALKVRITAAPVAGAANKQLLQFLAKALKLPRKHLSIQSGAKSRTKSILIEGVSKAEVRERLKMF
jgi:uncharacterized protein (TIGR00251 family)